jgi:hypothetical protein
LALFPHGFPACPSKSALQIGIGRYRSAVGNLVAELDSGQSDAERRSTAASCGALSQPCSNDYRGDWWRVGIPMMLAPLLEEIELRSVGS